MVRVPGRICARVDQAAFFWAAMAVFFWRAMAAVVCAIILARAYEDGFVTAAEKVAISIVQVNILAPITGAHDVIEGPGKFDSQLAWHERV
jgi:hypothetical protein